MTWSGDKLRILLKFLPTPRRMLIVYRACSALCASQLAILSLAMALHGPSVAHLVSIRFAEELVCAPTSTWRNASAASALAGSASAVRWVVHEYPLQVRFDPHFGPRFGTPSVGQP